MALGSNPNSEGASPEESGFEGRAETLEERNRELEAANERLRTVSGPRVTYRRAAVLFLVVSVVATVAAVPLPESRVALVGVAGVGALGAVLLAMRAQEQFLSASVGRALYDTLRRNETHIASQLETGKTVRYVPMDGDPPPVRLYLSRSLDDPLPASGSVDSTAIDLEDHYALLLEPTGHELVSLYERTNGPVPDDLRRATTALREAVVEQFELAVGVELVDVELATGPGGGRNRMRIRVTGSVLGDAARLDHPIRSLFGVVIARVVDGPVESEAKTDDDGTTTLTFRWGTGSPGTAD